MTQRAMSPVEHLRELAAIATRVADELGPQIEHATELVRQTLTTGGTLFFCGNGGSAADAQHIATEYTVRYLRSRRALRAIALTTDTSALTAIGNDFSFDEIFSRQLEALGRQGDLLIVHSTSGNSPNCIRVVEVAKRIGVTTLVLSARGGGALRLLADHIIVVPSDRTDRAQEVHLAVQHAICDAVDQGVAS